MTKLDRDDIRVRVAALMDHASNSQVFDEGLRTLLSSLGSEEQTIGARRLIPGMGESYGVPIPALRIVAAELAKWDPDHLDQAFCMVERLWHSGSRDERVIASKVLERLGKRQWERTLEVAASFLGSIRNWEECDQLGCFGLRSVVQRHPETVLSRCLAWVQHQDKWIRRFGVVVMTSLPTSKGYHPCEQEFAVLDMVMSDEAREVQDAADWALRKVGGRNPVVVAEYLRRHAKEAPRSTRRIIKRAIKVLSEGEREEIRALLL